MAGERMLRDVEFLKRAARAALKGRGFVEPNPVVGAIIVASGKGAEDGGEGTEVGGEVLTQGWHADYGGAHAERRALAKAGDRARGATLYVTLEPCSTQGKTPPCTEAVIEAGVRRVVAGALDPDPRHQGRGLELMRRAGIDAEFVPVAECESLLERFRACLELQRPFVILKWALTLDGRIAASDGSSRWISGEKSRRTVHRLRGHCDAVMVGSGTVLADDPSLNCRLKGVSLVPARVVVDPDLETPAGAKMLRLERPGPAAAGPVWILCSSVSGAAAQKAEVLSAAGAELVPLDCAARERGLFLEKSLQALRARGVRRLLVEGGSQLFTAFIEADLADQVVAFVGPRIIGGEGALCPVEGTGAASMAAARDLRDVSVTRSGADAMMVGFFR